MQNPNLLPFGMTLNASPRTKSPLAPFINPGIGQQMGQAAQNYQPQQSMGQRIQGILGTLLGAQNKSELSRGLLDFGSRMMAASAPGAAGSFLGALGESLPGTRQSLEQQRNEQQMMGALPEQFQKFGPIMGPQLYARMVGQVAPVGAAVQGLDGQWSVPSPVSRQEAIDALNSDSLYNSIARSRGLRTEKDVVNAPEALLREIDAEYRRAREGEERAGSGVVEPQGGVNVVQRGLEQQIGNFQSSAEAAFGQLPTMIGAVDTLENSDIQTGPGAEALNQLKTFVGAVTGVEMPGVADLEQITRIAASNQIAQLAAFKGPTSDKELAHVRKSSGDIGQSKAGNLAYFRGMRDLYAWRQAANEDLVRSAREAYSNGRDFTVFDAEDVLRKWRGVDIDGFYERNSARNGPNPAPWVR